MGLYDHIDSIMAALFRLAGDGTLAPWVSDGPALALRFWENSEAVAQGISIAQAAAAIASAAFAFIIAIAIMKKRSLAMAAAGTSAAVEVPTAQPYPVPTGGALRERWNEVLGHLESPREADWKVAVMEADKLVEGALARAGFPGDSFGDRLTNIQPGTLLALDGLWWAHKVRNRLAHEQDYFLRYTEAKQAVSYYEQALAELQLI